MALTWDTGMTQATSCDAVNSVHHAYRLSGSGQSPSAALFTDVHREGTGCMGGKCVGNNWDSGIIYDYYTDNTSTVLPLSTAGNEVLAIWAKIDTKDLLLDFNAEGMYIIASSSTETGTDAPTTYSKWTVSGADVYPGGWILFMVDTRKTPTVAVGGGADLANVRRIGFGCKNVSSVGTIRTEQFFVDSMWFGRPIYQVIGDGTLVADWDDFYQQSLLNEDALIEKVGGVLMARCGFRFGDSGQSNTTTFTDATGQQVSFVRQTYYQAGEVDALNYADYYLIDAQGNGTTRTSVTLGTVVGSGDNRQGVQGGAFRVEDTTNMTWKFDFQTDAADLDNVALYGVDFVGAKGGVLLDKANTDANLVSVAFVNCGEIDLGQTGTSPTKGAELLNAAVIDPLGGTAANRGLRMYDVNRVKRVSLITSGTPSTQHLTHHSEGGTITVEYDAIKYYGTYNGTTLWHGETSTASAAVTVSATNEADPNETYMDDTGAGASTTVQNDVNVTLTNVVIGSYYEVRRTDNGSLIMSGTAATATPSTTYNYPGSEVGVTIKVRKATIAPKYKRYRRTDVITGSGMSHQVAQNLDTLAS